MEMRTHSLFYKDGRDSPCLGMWCWCVPCLLVRRTELHLGWVRSHGSHGSPRSERWTASVSIYTQVQCHRRDPHWICQSSEFSTGEKLQDLDPQISRNVHECTAKHQSGRNLTESHSPQVKTHEGWKCDEGYGGTPAVHCAEPRKRECEKKMWELNANIRVCIYLLFIINTWLILYYSIYATTYYPVSYSFCIWFLSIDIYYLCTPCMLSARIFTKIHVSL